MSKPLKDRMYPKSISDRLNLMEVNQFDKIPYFQIEGSQYLVRLVLKKALLKSDQLTCWPAID